LLPAIRYNVVQFTAICSTNDDGFFDMDINERVALITRNLDEVIGADEIKPLLEQGVALNHYIGFEISGRLHIGTGLMCMQKVRDLQRAGVQCTIYLADWHTWINDKLGGDREMIKKIAVGYFKEGLSASLAALGGNPEAIRWVMGTDLYEDPKNRFWDTFVDVSKNTTLARVTRSISIMGRSEGDGIDFAKLLYPPMQVADIFTLRAHIAQGGMDQRKAHVIARDVATHLSVNAFVDAKGNKFKPIALHHHLLLGLAEPSVYPVPPDQLRDVWTSMKMSKSKPDTAVFINDSADDVRRKIRKAFCPPGDIDFNPVLDWAKHLIFQNERVPLKIARKLENGGDIAFHTYDELAEAFKSGALHPLDLKAGVADALNELLAPVRAYFEQPDVKQMWDELNKLLDPSAAGGAGQPNQRRRGQQPKQQPQ
jgi:tyrosyl-tRNA synthetase